MKIIYSKYIPMRGFRAINVLGIIVARKDAQAIDDQLIRYEKIHTRQMIELLIIGFYLWYVIEWTVRLFIYGDSYKAYQNISFEQEAYSNHDNIGFLKKRKWYNFVSYIRV